MTPFHRAAEVYKREPCAVPFEHDLFMHLLHGYVISTPQVFAMLREVSRDFTADDMRDPGKTAPGGDCWHVWLAAGDVSALLGMLSPKKWVAFERLNTPRVWEYERISRLWRSRVGSRHDSSQRETRPTVQGREF